MGLFGGLSGGRAQVRIQIDQAAPAAARPSLTPRDTPPKTEVWIAIAVYDQAAVVMKRLQLGVLPWGILRLTPFEGYPLEPLLAHIELDP